MRHQLDGGNVDPDTGAVTNRNPAEHIESACDVAIEVLGQLAEFWGFTRTMGRVFGLVYVSPQPVTQTELCERLSISPGSASMSLSGLQRWGAVRKAMVSQGRKIRYEAETDFRKIVTSVLESRERQTLEDAMDAVAHALDKLHRSGEHDATLDENARVVLERLRHLDSVYKLSYRLLQLLLKTGRVDVEQIAEASGHSNSPPSKRR